ncbi:MAG TPA: hypothetical protein VFV61_00915, partial [Pyrinomonadaceae bacterium]|nr:hypothetical protein [Pyrinomonadaceae bacterium]
MQRRQKIVFVVVLLILLSQLPFAYRRRRLVRLQATIQQLNAERNTSSVDPGFSEYREYKGVVHVHSFLGGHSSGTFQEIIAAAKTNQLDFVVMTEHTERDINTAAMTLHGVHGGILFLNGNEVSAKDAGRVLLIPGLETQAAEDASLEDLAQQVRAKLGLSIVAYPEEFEGWNTNAYDGIEVYNLYTNAQQINPLMMFFDGLWCYRSYPELLFANFYRRPNESLRLWDQTLARGQRLTALAGVDAHANIGIGLQDASGKTLIGLLLDPYERSFGIVRVHALLSERDGFNPESVLGALRSGNSFIGFDLLADSTGFRFSGRSGGEAGMQGEELKLQGEA